MKLNKVLALALSGIMAVSMLAGCSGKTDDGKEEQTPATGIVAAVNDGQDAANEVKVTFTADATLDSQLSKAINACAEKANEATVQTALEGVIGGTTVKLNGSLTVGDSFMPYVSAMGKDTSKEIVGVRVIKATENFTEKAAMNEIAETVNTIVSKLEKFSSTPNQADKEYVAYDYAGTVSMVETTALDGTTAYYAAIVITNNCTLKTTSIDY